MTEAATVLDATGLLCPLPVLKARRALKAVPAGGVLEVLATDPGAVKDFEHFCRTAAVNWSNRASSRAASCGFV